MRFVNKVFWGKNLCVGLLQRRKARIEKSTKLVSHESFKVVLYGYNAASSRHGRLKHEVVSEFDAKTNSGPFFHVIGLFPHGHFSNPQERGSQNAIYQS